MRFANNNNNGRSQGCCCAPDAIDHDTDVSATSTVLLRKPQATSGHGEQHELHVAKSTARISAIFYLVCLFCLCLTHPGGILYSLLLLYFVAEVTAPVTGPAYVLQRAQRFRAVSCGSTAPVTVPAYVLQRFQRSRVNRHVKLNECVGTEYFFENAYCA